MKPGPDEIHNFLSVCKLDGNHILRARHSIDCEEFSLYRNLCKYGRLDHLLGESQFL